MVLYQSAKRCAGCVNLRILPAVLFIVAFLTTVVGSAIEVISIVEQSSGASCMIKLFSILESATARDQLSFRFLVFERDDFTSGGWQRVVTEVFPGTRLDSKPWRRPSTFPTLSGKGFAQEVVFARFYLPAIFPDLPRFIFLDNDIVVTTDLSQLHWQRLYTSEDIPGTEVVPSSAVSVNPRSMERVAQRPGGPVHSHHSHRNQQPAAMAFVYEHHPGYRDYLQAHFTLSDPLVHNSIRARGADVFMNAGVFVVDTRRWVERKCTKRMEALLLENREHRLFNTEAVGDQGPFLLLYGNDTAYLHPRYNMRRLPKKTINMLSTGVTGTGNALAAVHVHRPRCIGSPTTTCQRFLTVSICGFVDVTGIVHFAGTTHADAAHLCRYPLQHPLLLTAAVPLYLSIIDAFVQKHPAFRTSPFGLSANVCAEALPLMEAELKRLALKATYNPGAGGFVWPPASRSGK